MLASVDAMNCAQLLQHFDTLAETPDAVAKLRDLVLQLAVRGNLVPQSGNDESGAELLKCILEEKRRLTREGVIKKTLILDFITPDVCPFEMPKNWAWAYLNDFGDWGSGSTPIRSNHEFYDGTIPWLKSGELNDGIVSESEEKVTELALEKCSLRLNKPGDVLLAMYGATVGKVAILGVEATTNQAVCACTCFSGVFNRYLFFLLKAFKQQFISESAGAAQPNFSKDKIIRTVAPLPPLAEQRRIVAKVDELLALCDELEEAQTAVREHRTRLVRSALDHLTSSSRSSRRESALTETKRGKNLSGLTSAATKIEADDFQKHAAFVLQHSYLVLDSVSDLRQAILSLAVEGRLTSTSGAKWENLALSQITEAIVDCPHSTPKWTEKGRICVRTNQFKPGALDLTNPRFVSEETFRERIQRLRPKENDILYSREGGILGIACRVPPNTILCLGQRMMLIRAGALMHPAFLELVLNSPRITGIARRETTGGAAPHVNVTTVRAYPIPLPPRAEQQRIVAKVDELMRWCDALEARLTAAQTTAAALLDATLHQILTAPANGEL